MYTPTERNPMKIGDIVGVNDGSWATVCDTAGDGRFRRALGGVHLNKHRWRVVALGRQLPTGEGAPEENDALCVQVNAPEHLLCIQSRFLRIEKPSPRDGQVTIVVMPSSMTVKD